MPPPSSGGVALLEMLNILENYDLAGRGHNSSDKYHVLIEAMRRAFADRADDADRLQVGHLGVEHGVASGPMHRPGEERLITPLPMTHVNA